MMLIHALQDDRFQRAVRHYRFDPDTIVWQHYQELQRRWLTPQEKTKLTQLTSQLPQNAPYQGKGQYRITSSFINQIHILEWRAALRRAGLEEGSAAFILTEKVLDQALNGIQEREEAIHYLELLENDICLIAQTKVKARTHEAELHAKKRSILIDGFGAQKEEALTVRNAALDSLEPALPPVPNGTCQHCRTRPGKEYKFDYGRSVGGFTWTTLPPAAVNRTIEFHKYLGSFNVFFCGKCKWKLIGKQTIIGAISLVVFTTGLWLLLTYWDDIPMWLGLILFLIAGIASLISLLWMFSGGKNSFERKMNKLGNPKHLGVDLVVRKENKEFWTWVPDELKRS